jgi:hypothetical protein
VRETDGFAALQPAQQESGFNSGIRTNGGVLISPRSQANGLSRGLIEKECMSEQTYMQAQPNSTAPAGGLAREADSRRLRRVLANRLSHCTT